MCHVVDEVQVSLLRICLHHRSITKLHGAMTRTIAATRVPQDTMDETGTGGREWAHLAHSQKRFVYLFLNSLVVPEQMRQE